MPTSGSTLAYNLTVAVAESAGFDQSPLPSTSNSDPDEGTRDVLEEKLRAAEQSGRSLVIMKTHAAPTRSLRDAVGSGRALVQTHARDPRDIALSMRDAGKKGAEWERTNSGQPIRCAEDALPRLRRNVKRHKNWANIPGALCLHYELTAFSTTEAVRQISAHMNLPAMPLLVAFKAKSRFTQLNKGVSQLHKTEMGPEESTQWYEEFREHIDQYCPPHQGSGLASRIGTKIGNMIWKVT